MEDPVVNGDVTCIYCMYGRSVPIVGEDVPCIYCMHERSFQLVEMLTVSTYGRPCSRW
jgi:molybdenum cofactor biosynthesis enzyme MoaA